MTEKILRLIEEEPLRQRFSGAAAEGLEEYRFREILNRWLELLDAVFCC